jgi:RNA polymerase sigma-70 factor (ECF subfamily)
MDTPASLLERLRQPGEQQAWGRFVDLYTPLLYYWARRLGLPSAAAADLVQEVFVVLVRKLPEFRYDPHKSFRNWLRTITHNKWREHRRRRGPALAVAAGRLEDLPDQDDTGAFEEAEYRRHLVGRALELVQPEFPDTTWAAFREYVVCGKSAAEVAAALNISPGTVYAAKSRVLSRLRQEIDGFLR